MLASSVAAERPCSSNAPCGAAKAGLDTLVQGLSDSGWRRLTAAMERLGSGLLRHVRRSAPAPQAAVSAAATASRPMFLMDVAIAVAIAAAVLRLVPGLAIVALLGWPCQSSRHLR